MVQPLDLIDYSPSGEEESETLLVGAGVTTPKLMPSPSCKVPFGLVAVSPASDSVREAPTPQRTDEPGQRSRMYLTHRARSPPS